MAALLSGTSLRVVYVNQGRSAYKPLFLVKGRRIEAYVIIILFIIFIKLDFAFYDSFAFYW
jgi:hypothetical protein